MLCHLLSGLKLYVLYLLYIYFFRICTLGPVYVELRIDLCDVTCLWLQFPSGFTTQGVIIKGVGLVAQFPFAG